MRAKIGKSARTPARPRRGVRRQRLSATGGIRLDVLARRREFGRTLARTTSASGSSASSASSGSKKPSTITRRITIFPDQDIAAAWHLSRVVEDRRRDDLHAVHHIRAGNDYSQEFRIQQADGNLIWMKEDVRVKTIATGQWHLVGVTTEITDRKHAEVERERLLQEAREAHARLQQSETYLRLAVEGADVAIWQHDLRTGEELWSSKSKILFGIPADQEVTEDVFFKALHPDDRKRWQEAADQALAGKAEYQMEYRAVWPDGSLHWLESKGRTVQDEAGQFVRMEGVLLDISERKRLEEELAATARGYKRIAETLQRALISAPQSRNSKRLSVETLYQPAADQMLIGGDFYDLVVVDEDRVALVVGDLVGKGLAAATAWPKSSSRCAPF